MDIESFKEAVDGVDEWFIEELKSQGYEDAEELVEAFTGIGDYSDLGWEEIYLEFACSTTETSTWLMAAASLAKLMEKLQEGKVKVISFCLLSVHPSSVIRYLVSQEIPSTTTHRGNGQSQRFPQKHTSVRHSICSGSLSYS